MVHPLHSILTNLVLAALIVVAGCSKQPATVEAAGEQSQTPAGPKAMKGEVYRTRDRSEAITIVSDDELELRQGGVNLICKYTRQDGQLRVIANTLGTSQALYFRVTDDGLQDEQGKIFYKPSRFEAVDQLSTPERNMDESWARVLSAYEKRSDLIRQNAGLLQRAFGATAVPAMPPVAATAPKTAPQDAEELDRFNRAQMNLSQALSRLLTISQSYPQLRNDTEWQAFQAQLEGIENRISVERDKFSDAVRHYNELLPAGAHPRPYFAGSTPRAQAPTVNFDFGQPSASPSP